jgi:hypothetical protein
MSFDTMLKEFLSESDTAPVPQKASNNVNPLSVNFNWTKSALMSEIINSLLPINLIFRLNLRRIFI